MTPAARRVVFTAHVTSSIGWFGAVAAFLVLAIAGLSYQDLTRVRAAYLAMQWTTWFVIVPFALLSLLSGVISSLATRWGLVRCYWVLLKLLVTLFATVVLLVHTEPIDTLASVAIQATGFNSDLHGRQLMMVVASAGALAVLIVLTVLSVYKPQGITRYGARVHPGTREPTAPQ